MFQKKHYTGTREANYEIVLKQLKALLEGEKNPIANLANAASLLNQFLSEINWVGFYLYIDGELVLGPFQGFPACTRIPLGKGVCGTAAKERKILCVEDVEKFPGHIACDAASRSEIVLPLVKHQKLLGVLDIDSPKFKRFDSVDSEYLNRFCDILLSSY